MKVLPDMPPCECSPDYTCDGCLRDLEAEWRIEHAKEMEYSERTSE